MRILPLHLLKYGQYTYLCCHIEVHVHNLHSTIGANSFAYLPTKHAFATDNQWMPNGPSEYDKYQSYSTTVSEVDTILAVDSYALPPKIWFKALGTIW